MNKIVEFSLDSCIFTVKTKNNPRWRNKVSPDKELHVILFKNGDNFSLFKTLTMKNFELEEFLMLKLEMELNSKVSSKFHKTYSKYDNGLIVNTSYISFLREEDFNITNDDIISLPIEEALTMKLNYNHNELLIDSYNTFYELHKTLKVIDKNYKRQNPELRDKVLRSGLVEEYRTEDGYWDFDKDFSNRPSQYFKFSNKKTKKTLL